MGPRACASWIPSGDNYLQCVAAVTRAQASVLAVDTGKTNNLWRATLSQAYHSQNRRDETATTTNLAALTQGQWGSALGQAQGDHQEKPSAIICYETSTFHFLSWLLAGKSNMVTWWWCLTYTLITYWWHIHHLLYWHGYWSHDDSLLIRVHFLQWHGLVGFPPRHHYLFIVLHDSSLVMHLSCWLMRSSLLWLRAAPYCTLLCTVTYCCSDAIVLVMPIVRITSLFSYSI